jgi:ParB-like chromosome segregation protein Spo0J
LKINIVALESVTPYEKNPRNSDAAVDAVAESIREFGFRQPIVVDEQNVIVCGHARYFAAIRLGLDKVPVHVAKDLTAEQVRAYRLADNKSAELAGWDKDLLEKEILALNESSGLDLTSFGFDKEFLDSLGDQVKADLTKKPETGAKQLQLRFGKYSVPIDETEFGKLVTLLTEHEETSGTRFGFVTWLLGSKESPQESQTANV